MIEKRNEMAYNHMHIELNGIVLGNLRVILYHASSIIAGVEFHPVGTVAFGRIIRLCAAIESPVVYGAVECVALKLR